MFRRLFNKATAAVGAFVLKFAARASVALPFVVALGFAMAAVAVMLVERFGYITGHWMMAGGLATLGVIAAIAVGVKERREEVAEQEAEQGETKEAVRDVTAETLAQTPVALLGSLLSIQGGGSAALTTARLLSRNLPLVLLAAIVGALLWPARKATSVKAPMPIRATDADGRRTVRL